MIAKGYIAAAKMAVACLRPCGKEPHSAHKHRNQTIGKTGMAIQFMDASTTFSKTFSTTHRK